MASSLIDKYHRLSHYVHSYVPIKMTEDQEISPKSESFETIEHPCDPNGFLETVVIESVQINKTQPYECTSRVN